MLGYEHGAKIGFTKGYEQGIEDLFSQIKKEASLKLREEKTVTLWPFIDTLSQNLND